MPFAHAAAFLGAFGRRGAPVAQEAGRYPVGGTTCTRTPVDVHALRALVRLEAQRLSVLQTDGFVCPRQLYARFYLQGGKGCRGRCTISAMSIAGVTSGAQIGKLDG